eukprot:SAG11_NODE_6739_length_1256_cov_2.891098_1_plen_227_part_10
MPKEDSKDRGNLAEASEEKQADAGGADSAGESAPAPTTVMLGGGRQTAGCTGGASAFGMIQAESQAVTPSLADGIEDKTDEPRGGRKDAPRRCIRGSMGSLGAAFGVDGRLLPGNGGLDARDDTFEGSDGVVPTAPSSFHDSTAAHGLDGGRLDALGLYDTVGSGGGTDRHLDARESTSISTPTTSPIDFHDLRTSPELNATQPRLALHAHDIGPRSSLVAGGERGD